MLHLQPVPLTTSLSIGELVCQLKEIWSLSYFALCCKTNKSHKRKGNDAMRSGSF